MQAAGPETINSPAGHVRQIQRGRTRSLHGLQFREGLQKAFDGRIFRIGSHSLEAVLNRRLTGSLWRAADGRRLVGRRGNRNGERR